MNSMWALQQPKPGLHKPFILSRLFAANPAQRFVMLAAARGHMLTNPPPRPFPAKTVSAMRYPAGISCWIRKIQKDLAPAPL